MSPDAFAKTADLAPWDQALLSMRLVTPLSRSSQVLTALTWTPQLEKKNHERMHSCIIPTLDTIKTKCGAFSDCDS